MVEISEFLYRKQKPINTTSFNNASSSDFGLDYGLPNLVETHTTIEHKQGDELYIFYVSMLNAN